MSALFSQQTSAAIFSLSRPKELKPGPTLAEVWKLAIETRRANQADPVLTLEPAERWNQSIRHNPLAISLVNAGARIYDLRERVIDAARLDRRFISLIAAINGEYALLDTWEGNYRAVSRETLSGTMALLYGFCAQQGLECSIEDTGFVDLDVMLACLPTKPPP